MSTVSGVATPNGDNAVVAEPARQSRGQADHRHRRDERCRARYGAGACRAGAQVILAVRNLELGAQRAAEIGGDVSVVKLDLADLASVRAFPTLFDGDVDILINNAGVVAQHRAETVDGFESTLGTNFLGPFALTNLLFGRVRSQIINVGSDAHKSATFAFDDPHLRGAEVVRVPRPTGARSSP